MTERMRMGRFPDGSWDARIARPGYSVYDDVSDRKKMAFAASRGVNTQVNDAGIATALDTWISMPNTPGIALPLFNLRRGGQQITGLYEQVVFNLGPSLTAYRYGTAYVAVADAGRIAFTRAFGSADTYPPMAGDQFSYFGIGV